MRRASLLLATGLLGVLLAWEYGLDPLGIPEYLLPRPSVVVQKWLSTLAVQLEHLSVTAATTAGGLLLALGAGLTLALLTIYVRPLQAIVLPAFAAFNATLAIWSLVAYIGIWNSIVDIWLGLTKPLYVDKKRKNAVPSTAPATESIDWRSVLYHGHAGGEVPHLERTALRDDVVAVASDEPVADGQKQAA